MFRIAPLLREPPIEPIEPPDPNFGVAVYVGERAMKSVKFRPLAGRPATSASETVRDTPVLLGSTSGVASTTTGTAATSTAAASRAKSTTNSSPIWSR